MSSFSKGITEREERLKVLKEKLQEIDEQGNAIREEISSLEIANQLYRSTLIDVKRKNEIFRTAESRMNSKKKKIIKFWCICAPLMYIVSFLIGKIFSGLTVFHFGYSALVVLALSTACGVANYFISTKEERKRTGGLSLVALRKEIVSSKDEMVSLSKSMSDNSENKMLLSIKLDNLLSKNNYYELKREKETIESEIKALKKEREEAVFELLDDLLTQQEQADVEFRELSPELQELFMDAVLKEIEIGSGRPGRPFRTRIKVPDTTTNKKI